MDKFSYLDTLFEAAAVIDKQGSLVYYNHNFSTLFQASPRILRKVKKIDELFTEENPFPNSLLDQALENPGTYLSGEIDIKSTEQAEASHVVVKLTSLGEDQFLVCFNDMSIEHKLYSKYRLQINELKQNHNQILQSDKLTTIGEITASISHEISNPLTIAAGNLEVLEETIEDEKLDDEETVVGCLQDIKESHERITAIIRNMKTFLHNENEDDSCEYVNLQSVVEDSLKFLNPVLTEKKVKLQTEFKEKDIVGLVNRGKIEQVLVNLVNNAVDALMEAKTDSPEIVIQLKKDRKSNLLELRVRDNGPGIPDKYKEDIFNSFFTTKDVGEGTGLGLAIVSKIIEAHQGKIQLEDSEGGASFLVQLPFIEVLSYGQNEMLQSARDNTSTDTLKILVLDNEVQVLNILNKIFYDEGIVFMGSVNGTDALKMLEDISVDLIITDFVMPAMDGAEFSQKVRDLNISTPIMYLSAASNQEFYQRDKAKFGISGMILKPFTKEEVLKAIYAVVGKRKEE